MKNKRVTYISLGIIFLLTITLFIYLSTFVQPKIIFTAKISKISGEDYKKMMSTPKVMLAGQGIEKFRHINMQVKIITPFPIINDVEIEKSSSQQYFIQPYLKNNDKIQILGGSTYAHGNGKEYAESSDIYMKNISEDELKGVLGDLKIKIIWQNIWNKKESQIFYFKDYLK